MAGSFGIVIGGCWYRLQCREVVAASIHNFAFMAGQIGAPLLGMSVQHTSNLPQGRCEWLNRQIDNREAKWAVSIDTDTEFNGQHLIQSFEVVARDGVALGLAPVRQGGTAGICQLNLLGDDERLGIRDGKQPNGEYKMVNQELARVLSGSREIASGGFGLAVFHLDWFREYWPKTWPEVAESARFGGEDIEMCRAIRRRGGKILALSIDCEHHEFKP